MGELYGYFYSSNVDRNDDIPFDLQAYRHVVYETTMSGGSKLRDDIKKYISELKK